MKSTTQRGFTLVEMIMVIVITGIIGGMVAMFIRAPMQGYVDSARRADMTDIADTAMRRMARDLRTALPNSVRISTVGVITYLEFIPIITGGRYRNDVSGGAVAGNPLKFGIPPVTSFDALVPFANLGIAVGDAIVVYNLGIPGATVYDGINSTTVTAVATGALPNESTITIAAKAFPLDSCQPNPVTGAVNGCRYHVIRTPVTYVCNPVAGTLTRFSGYAIAPIQPTAGLPGGNLLASNVSACTFTYDANVVAQSAGLVTLALTITEQGESVSLYNAIHVNNVP